ncbi:hypothetical protein BCR32DRAFT_282230 [Anaeromyces robustus]|uniref:Uncharacterized protein n=1 Tax=Anaeromyces robustus TaxID=1754192 RepID=A0A1Y1WZG5_9FUNG|nr:hypothetical protein BCR32DRAFT_282230 [Anaeromyces robustus]|eukprot:ORX78484.1 hypothetical protein BCR32DRAFT_282230 [Anaeromyces robustus]
MLKPLMKLIMLTIITLCLFKIEGELGDIIEGQTINGEGQEFKGCKLEDDRIYIFSKCKDGDTIIFSDTSFEYIENEEDKIAYESCYSRRAFSEAAADIIDNTSKLVFKLIGCTRLSVNYGSCHTSCSHTYYPTCQSYKEPVLDIVFKNLFGEKKNQTFMINFFNSILNREGDDRIITIEYLKTENTPIQENKKLAKQNKRIR